MAHHRNITTTLGREGSVLVPLFSPILPMPKKTIWKDVDGLLNADPKQFSDTVQLDKIPYYEAIELAYYSASVIHPKTIKTFAKQKHTSICQIFYPLQR